MALIRHSVVLARNSLQKLKILVRILYSIIAPPFRAVKEYAHFVVNEIFRYWMAQRRAALEKINKTREQRMEKAANSRLLKGTERLEQFLAELLTPLFFRLSWKSSLVRLVRWRSDRLWWSKPSVTSFLACVGVTLGFPKDLVSAAALINRVFGKVTSSVASEESEWSSSNSHSVMDAAKLSQVPVHRKSKVITTVIAITITVVVQ